MGSAGTDKASVSDGEAFDSDKVSVSDGEVSDSDKVSVSDDKVSDSDKVSVSDSKASPSDDATSTPADWAFLVDTPVCEFTAVGGIGTSGRTSGVSPVHRGSEPPSWVLTISPNVCSVTFISMTLPILSRTRRWT